MLIIAVFIQATILNYFNIFGVKADVVLVCVVFFGLFLGPASGLEAGFIAGFLQDLLALDFFGINTVVMGTTGLLAGVINEKVFKESGSTRIILVLFFVFFSMTLHFFLASIFSKYLNIGFAEYFANSIVPAGIYTSLVSVPILSKFADIYALKDMEELI